MEKENKLTRGLTLFTLFTLITGAMVGMAWAILANVFLDRAGPAVMISIGVAAILTLFVGLCFAELCSAMPYAGGAYIYVRRGINKFVGFIAGWLLVMAYAAMMPGECIILGKLINGVFPTLDPAMVGAVLALVFTLVNLAGIRFSGLVQFLLTAALFRDTGAGASELQALLWARHRRYFSHDPHRHARLYGLRRAAAGRRGSERAH